MAVFLFASVAPAWAAAVKRPAITAGGAVTYCQNTGEIIYANDGVAGSAESADGTGSHYL